ncbi:MAG: recombinase family protein [Cyanobacteria bacterium J06626_18]
MSDNPVTAPGVSEKIRPHHLDRLAIVYVRQSTLQQVMDHQESTRRQYGLSQRAESLGWQQDRIITIDDDLGKSGSTVEGRLGFQRLVSEVGLNHVGLILGIEMSRLAWCSKDWHQLLEICALFNTLIADLDGIYDPSHYNDRLLLGLKGTMSEAELHILKQRMGQGKLNKAKRGELGFHVPIGYVRRPSGEIRLDPDEQAQQVVRLIFRKFDELGSLAAVLQYLVRHQIQIGVRAYSGVNKGDLDWRRPNRTTLQNILKNPAYAGAYAYGRSHRDPRKQVAGRPHTGHVVTPREHWQVLIQDHHPAYISWEQYEAHLAQLKANQARADELGLARYGTSLLSGLLICGHCGSLMTVQYHRGKQHRYICCREATNYGGEICQCLSGQCLDEYVSTQVLHALEPAAVELSLAAAQHLAQERTELDQLWQKRLERAAYEAERAGRHYRSVEPENRLVARQLAQEWETKLKEQQQLQEAYQRFIHEQPKTLSNQELQAIRELSHGLPMLWNAQATTQSQKKEIIRQVIQTISVTVHGQSEQVDLTLQWVGGWSCDARIRRPVSKWPQLSNYPQLCQRLKQLAASELSIDDITQCLNQEGFYPPKRRDTFNSEGTRGLMRRLGLLPPATQRNQTSLAEHEWWLRDLARTLAMPSVTLYDWVRRRWVRARQEPQYPHHWIIWADEAELNRLRQHRQQPIGNVLRQRWKGQVPDIAVAPAAPATESV